METCELGRTDAPDRGSKVRSPAPGSGARRPAAPVAAAVQVRGLDAFAVAAMVVLCASWGFQQTAVKVALTELPPFLQSAVRSAIAAVLVAGWSVARGRSLFDRDGTLGPGSIAGLLFAVEFVLIYVGLQWTDASRAALFIYTAPFFVALGSIWVLPEERLAAPQWLGLAFSFGGVALALGLPPPSSTAQALLGDAALVLAGALWGATTLVIKATRLRRTTPEKVLLYQLAISAVVCAAAAGAVGENVSLPLSMPVLGAIAYQSIWVAGVTYLVWFWLVRRHPAGQLSAFTFLAPLFGIAAGHLVLSEPLTRAFIMAAALVAIGLVLVSRPSVTPARSARQEQNQ